MRLRSINNLNLARPRIIVAIALLSVAAFAQSASSEQRSASSDQNDVVIKNAIVMTVTHGNIQGGSLMDYLVPTSMETPAWETDKTCTPSPHRERRRKVRSTSVEML